MRVMAEKCIGCGLCVQLCPFGAVHIENEVAVIGEDCKACGACLNECPSEALKSEVVDNGACDVAKYSGYWVIGLETQQDPNLAKVTLELLSTARKLARKKHAPIVLVVFVPQLPERWLKDAASVGCDEILCLNGCSNGIMGLWTQALADASRHYMPEVMLFPAVADGRDLAPKVACRLQTGLTADCTALDMDEDGNLLQIRPTYGGNIIATIRTLNRRPQMASVRPNVMDLVFVEKTRLPVVTYIAVKTVEVPIKHIATIRKNDAFQNLEEAEIILAGGYGLGSRENFQKLMLLASRMNAAVAVSRKVVDAEWANVELQVGQTGKTVRPKLYITFGISGALQHVLGMKHSGRIIAINNDPAAPMMKICDVPILGDAARIIEEMLALLEKGYSPLDVLEGTK